MVPTRASRLARWPWSLAMVVAVAASSFGCREGSRSTPDDDDDELPAADAALCPDQDDDFCMPAGRLETDLRRRELTVLGGHETAQGNSAPFKLRVAVEANGRRTVYHVKHKPVPASFDEPNNSPRRELAAYALQKLFLDEDRYVVPPTALRCLPRKGPLADAPKSPLGSCVLGVTSFWVENARELVDSDLDGLVGHSPRAERVGDLNVLTYLEGHRDDVGLNFLIATDSDDPRALSIDNGIAFEMWKYNPIRLFTSSWSRLKVPTVRVETIARLRRLERSELFEQLGAVGQVTLVEGDVKIVEPEKVFDASRGVRRRGSTVQLGLTTSEIASVWDHVQQLLAEVDEGAVALTKHVDRESR